MTNQRSQPGKIRPSRRWYSGSSAVVRAEPDGSVVVQNVRRYQEERKERPAIWNSRGRKTRLGYQSVLAR